MAEEVAAERPHVGPLQGGEQARLGREIFFHLRRGSSKDFIAKSLISKSEGAGPILTGLEPSSRVGSSTNGDGPLGKHGASCSKRLLPSASSLKRRNSS